MDQETDHTEGEPIEISNEFATVRVSKVHTRNGVRLRISAPKGGTSIELDALALESLTWQRAETFTRLLSKPFTPFEEG